MHSNRAMRLAALFEVALMVFFRAIKFRGRLNLRHDRPAKTSALVDLFFRCLRRCLLRGRMIEDHGAILRSDVWPLVIQSGRIVVRPKNIEKFIVANLRWIEFNFDNFGVSRLVRANVLVSRVLLRSAGVTHRCRSYAFQFAKSFFYAPEAARAKCRLLC